MNEISVQESKLDNQHDDSLPVIRPLGYVESDIRWMTPAKLPNQPLLFIGGPLDGRMISMPPDGRQYDHKQGDCIDPDIFRYSPALMSFQGQRKMVYLLMERITAISKPLIESRKPAGYLDNRALEQDRRQQQFIAKQNYIED